MTLPTSIDLLTLLSGDLGSLIIDHLDDLGDLAALELWLAPRQPSELLRLAIDRCATRIVAGAPLHLACERFEKQLWPPTVAAADWHPRSFFADMRAPAFCRVAGGKCFHGLCQKQERARAGVHALLERLALPSSSVASRALECLAWLDGALGKNEEARRTWWRAAAAGSARARLDIGLRLYRSGKTPSTVYYSSSPEPRQSATRFVCEEAPTSLVAASMLASTADDDVVDETAAAADASRRAAEQLEILLVGAKAMLYLGMMSLDGDGADQSDKAATRYLAEARRYVRRGEAAATKLVQHEEDAAPPRARAQAAGKAVGRAMIAAAAAEAAAHDDMCIKRFRQQAQRQLREIDEAARETLEEEAKYATVYAAPASVALTS